ncbi:nucleoside diphosphate kinase homolog 5 isoform X2 [Passer domesticus]|uniref:nucleoside diphosphate kinase homolog 5 isoform X2 n=1 Tax=Passer domesticus TaxID=48849 RepID=UPI0030FE6A37
MEVLMPEPQIYVERTLAIIKPDVINKEEEIEDLILRSGFHIIQAAETWKGFAVALQAVISLVFSLRALFGTDELRNGLHGSLSISSAEKEIRFIFPEAILEPVPTGQRARDYLNLYVKPTLLAGLTALCKEKPADPMIWLADWLIEHNPNKPKLQYRISQRQHWQ